MAENGVTAKHEYEHIERVKNLARERKNQELIQQEHAAELLRAKNERYAIGIIPKLLLVLTAIILVCFTCLYFAMSLPSKSRSIASVITDLLG